MASLSDLMDAIGDAVGAITDLRVFPYWADKVTPPAAIVGLPDEIAFDAAMQRGADTVTLPLIVVVGRSDARTTRDRLAVYAAGSGPQSVKAAVEAIADPYSVRVEKAEFGTASIAGVSYLAATFTINVAMSGTE